MDHHKLKRALSILAIAALSCVGSAQAQAVAEDGQPVYSGPAYQFEGKWSARLQSRSGTLIDTLANCSQPIILVADNSTTLRRSDGGTILVTPVDENTLSWSENGQTTIVTPESHGNFVSLTARNRVGLLDPSSVVSYLRCGTVGATAAEQVCVDN